MIFKFLKFGIVGSAGMLIDFGLTYLFKEVFRANRYVANTIGFVTAATNNYFLNRIWTFASTSTHIVYEFSTFVLVALVGLAINNLTLYTLERSGVIAGLIAKVHQLKIGSKLPFYIAKFFAIAVTTLWNFFANYFITFSV